jgi:microcystin-dependent protein
MAPPGTVILWAGTLANVPSGWLHCDGTALTQLQFPDLFTAIGFNFGAEPPPGQFFLPDLRGRFIRGLDDNAGRDPDSASRVDMQNSNIVTATVGSVQQDAFQNHTHGYTLFPWGADGDGIAGGSYWATNSSAQTGTSSSPQASTETRPINVYLIFLIRYLPETQNG